MGEMASLTKESVLTIIVILVVEYLPCIQILSIFCLIRILTVTLTPSPQFPAQNNLRLVWNFITNETVIFMNVLIRRGIVLSPGAETFS